MRRANRREWRKFAASPDFLHFARRRFIHSAGHLTIIRQLMSSDKCMTRRLRPEGLCCRRKMSGTIERPLADASHGSVDRAMTALG